MVTDPALPYYLFLCGGVGDRFRQVTPVPKPSMCIHGRPMYQWVIDSLLRGLHALDPVDASSDVCKAGCDIVVATHNTASGIGLFCSIRKRYADFPLVTFTHAPIAYATRGPVETASVALTALTTLSAFDQTRPFWILDNDVVYDVTTPWTTALTCSTVAAVLTSVLSPVDRPAMGSQSSPFSHVVCSPPPPQVDVEIVEAVELIDIVEKRYVSDMVVMGGYGFGGGAVSFRSLVAEYLDRLRPVKSCPAEWFLSDIIKTALVLVADQRSRAVKAVMTPGAFTIGTPLQIRQALAEGRLSTDARRTWIFDLDQTLVTLPRIPGDYSTCLAIPATIALVRRLFADGDHIVIHTARGMLSYKGDVASIQRRLGPITRASLCDLDIPYHELIFGKPHGDVYVDDKSVNPVFLRRIAHPGVRMGRVEQVEQVEQVGQDLGTDVRHWTTMCLGFGDDDTYDASQDDDERTRRPIADNVVRGRWTDVIGGTGELHVCRKTAERWSQLAGYTAFLRRMHDDPACSSVVSRVPRLMEVDTTGPSIVLEWLKGISAARLNAWGMLTADVMDATLDLLADFHAISNDASNDQIAITQPLIMSSYLPKLDARIAANPDVYARLFLDSTTDVQAVRDTLAHFFETYSPSPTAVIHGDLWLHNIVWDASTGTVRTIDMRGRLGPLGSDTITTSGDRAYDYAKLLQSLAGFDALLFRAPGCGVATMVSRVIDAFWDKTDSSSCGDRTPLDRLRDHAEEHDVSFADVHLIAASMILGSVPFHPELCVSREAATETCAVILALLGKKHIHLREHGNN